MCIFFGMLLFGTNCEKKYTRNTHTKYTTHAQYTEYTHNRHNTQHLDGVHTCFGKVSEGLNVIDSIQAGDKFTITLMD